ncbi:MAG: carbohydrate binding domain-containing protein [Chthoniobacteraceae bacterium]
MKTPRIVLLLLLGAGFIRAQAQENPAPAPPAAPAQTEMQKWIAATDAQWQAAFKRDVTDVHEAELNKVKLQFLNLLETGIAKASAAGDLNGALALRNEQKRFGDTQVFPEKDEDSDAASVKAIRAAIRAQLAKLEKDTAARAKALHATYDQLLERAQTQLTQHQRLDDALLVKTKRDEVKAAWLAALPAVAEQPKAQPPMAPPKPAVASSPESARGNLFKNPNFENGTDDWKITASKKLGKVQIDLKERHNGKPSLRIENSDFDHTLVTQKIAVKPNTRYLLEGYIKTDNVKPEKYEKEGAELMVTGGWKRTEPLPKTHGWTRVTLSYDSESHSEIEVGASLGHYYCASKGTAWFSELSLTELGQNAKAGKKK